MANKRRPDESGARTIRTLKAQEAFCEALAAGLSVAASAKAAGIGRRSAYEWKDEDPVFAAAWEEAYEQATDDLEDIAHHRAVVKSDSLMVMFLKARRPEKYKDRQEHTGAVTIVQQPSPIFAEDS